MKKHLLVQNASFVFEDECRSYLQGAKKYWEKHSEFDAIRHKGKGVVVSEFKFTKLSNREKQQIMKTLKEKWKRTKIARNFRHVKFEIIDIKILKKLASRKAEN